MVGGAMSRSRGLNPDAGRPGLSPESPACASLRIMVVVRALLAVALCGLPAFTQEPRLADKADAAVARSGLSGGRLAIFIYSTRAEAPVYDRDAKKVCRLASNTKLFTTAC